MTRTTYVLRGGRLIDKRKAPPLHAAAAAPMIRPDGMAPVRSMVDGRTYESRSAYWLNAAGTHGLATFHQTLEAIRAGCWQEAHDRLLNSAWAREVGARAGRLARQLLTGVRAPEAVAA